MGEWNPEEPHNAQHLHAVVCSSCPQIQTDCPRHANQQHLSTTCWAEDDWTDIWTATAASVPRPRWPFRAQWCGWDEGPCLSQGFLPALASLCHANLSLGYLPPSYNWGPHQLTSRLCPPPPPPSLSKCNYGNQYKCPASATWQQ